MLIFKKAKDGTLQIDGLKKIANVCDVTTEGVKGAKSFFEAKANELTKDAKFEQEIKGENVTKNHAVKHDYHSLSPFGCLKQKNKREREKRRRKQQREGRHLKRRHKCSSK